MRCIPRGEGHPDRAKGLSAGESPEGDFLEVLLEVDRTTGDLASVLVRQPGGVELEYRFADWEFNPPLEESLFHFAAPIGVAVVEAPSDSAGGEPRTH